MIDHINSFFTTIRQTPIELYSEFGLQHELALFLRSNYPDLTIRLEYPTPRIFNPLPQFIKKEIDIYITTSTGLKFAIELKMPKDDCGAPNEMYRAIQDVKFLEQLRHNNIDGCYAILFTERQAFWQAPQANAGIYQYFNGQQVNIQSVDVGHLPNFLHKKGPLELNNVYQGNWNSYTDIHNTNWKYYVLNI
jgi:hypothetical protein